MEEITESAYAIQEELKLLDPGGLRLCRDAFEDLQVEFQDGRVLGPVAVVRAFPISATGDFVILKDGDGKELGVIRRVAELDPASRQVLEAELERVYFTPRITRIRSIKVDFRIPKWEVETDRGHRIFEISNSRNDIHSLGGGRVLIRDADGNRYEIPDYRKLDPFSYALVEGQI
jgi:hypothetical protein